MDYLHTMVRVENLDASLAFYCEALGLEIIRRSDHDKGRFSLVFLATPDDAKAHKANPDHNVPMIELTYNWPNEGGTGEQYSGGRNFGHLAYRVDDIYATCQHLIDHGVKINRPPRDGRMAFVRSPDNISVELLQKGDALDAIEPWASMDNNGEW